MAEKICALKKSGSSGSIAPILHFKGVGNTISNCTIQHYYVILKAGSANQTLAINGGTSLLTDAIQAGSSYIYVAVVLATATTMILSGVGSNTSSVMAIEL